MNYAQPGRPQAPPRREQGDRIIWDNYGGRLLIVEPLRFKAAVNTQHGPRDVVNANITVVDTGERFHDAGIFPYYLVGQVKDHINSKVLGRLAKQQVEGSDNLAWVLLPASQQDIAQAEHFERTGQAQQTPAYGNGYPAQQLGGNVEQQQGGMRWLDTGQPVEQRYGGTAPNPPQQPQPGYTQPLGPPPQQPQPQPDPWGQQPQPAQTQGRPPWGR